MTPGAPVSRDAFLRKFRFDLLDWPDDFGLVDSVWWGSAASFQGRGYLLLPEQHPLTGLISKGRLDLSGMGYPMECMGDWIRVRKATSRDGLRSAELQTLARQFANYTEAGPPLYPPEPSSVSRFDFEPRATAEFEAEPLTRFQNLDI